MNILKHPDKIKHLHGKAVKIKMEGRRMITGRISIQGNHVYIVHNEDHCHGNRPMGNMFEFSRGWCLGPLKPYRSEYNPSVFKLIHESELKEYYQSKR